MNKVIAISLQQLFLTMEESVLSYKFYSKAHQDNEIYYLIMKEFLDTFFFIIDPHEVTSEEEADLLNKFFSVDRSVHYYRSINLEYKLNKERFQQTNKLTEIALTILREENKADKTTELYNNTWLYQIASLVYSFSNEFKKNILNPWWNRQLLPFFLEIESQINLYTPKSQTISLFEKSDKKIESYQIAQTMENFKRDAKFLKHFDSMYFEHLLGIEFSKLLRVQEDPSDFVELSNIALFGNEGLGKKTISGFYVKALARHNLLKSSELKVIDCSKLQLQTNFAVREFIEELLKSTIGRALYLDRFHHMFSDREDQIGAERGLVKFFNAEVKRHRGKTLIIASDSEPYSYSPEYYSSFNYSRYIRDYYEYQLADIFEFIAAQLGYSVNYTDFNKIKEEDFFKASYTHKYKNVNFIRYVLKKAIENFSIRAEKHSSQYWEFFDNSLTYSDITEFETVK